MSGIAGIIHFDRMPVQAGCIESMTDAMAHRARDGCGHWREGSTAFGHCLLVTTPESVDDRQPRVLEASGRVIALDGRIDNAAELRRDLRARGTVFRTATDSELVLHAYDQWGDDLPGHLDGDFAFGLWDPRERKLLCARDRTGSRPFHYHWNGNTLAFASDASALLALPGIDLQLNLDFVAEILASEWMSLEDTYWRGVRRLPPAHQMIVSAAGSRVARYWYPRLDGVPPCRSPQEYAEYYRSLLFDVVRRMGRSCGPVACEVSGGLDSSALFAVATNLQRQGALQAPDVHGYTLNFRGAGDADEMDYAQAVASHVGKPLHEVAPTRKSLHWYEEWVAREGYPAGYPNGVMSLGIREEARRRGSNCLIVGVGGDEWLDGNPTYFADAMAAGQWRALWRMLREDAADVGVLQTGRWLARYGVAPLLPAALRHAYHAYRRHSTRFDDWLSAPMQARLRERRRAWHPAPLPSSTSVGQRSLRLLVDGAYSLLARESEERLCAHAGLEIRRPFWDARIIEFAFATPERLRCHGSTNRALHRQAMEGLLPERVRQRESKADFMIAFDWSMDELRERLERALPHIADWVSPEMARRILADCGDPRHSGWPEWRAWGLYG
ncbi:MAG TPA: asparagine synthase (glutamine-hydrolyzing), partial [Steroidobacteraceae bacterium]